MKKVGIYNPHIHTMGGGEKVTLALAEKLSQQYHVDLIVRDKVQKKKFEEFFNVNLKKVSIIILAKESFIIRALASPRLRLPGRIREIISSRCDYAQLKKLDLDIFINSYYQSNCKSVAPIGIYVCMFPQTLNVTAIGKKSWVVGAYHTTMDIFERILGLGRKSGVDSYETILANSEYTREWINKLWKRDAEILYPICDNMGPAGPKEKIILNVGRLFASSDDNHHKCQDVLLSEFKKMKHLHEEGWQLHFAGSTAKDPDSLKYVIRLIEEARGYPVFFHLNISHSQLKSLYRKAAIYWHATGYGKNPLKKPETQEHFGITTVEAMSAGVVPVVINSAGQKETVANGKTGYLWNDLGEMIDFTNILAKDEAKRASMAKLAIRSSHGFGRAAFDDTIEKIMTKIENEALQK